MLRFHAQGLSDARDASRQGCAALACSSPVGEVSEANASAASSTYRFSKASANATCVQGADNATVIQNEPGIEGSVWWSRFVSKLINSDMALQNIFKMQHSSSH